MKVAQLYEGKAKIIYSTTQPDQLIVYYKDDTTAGDGAKKAQIQGKGPLNLKISDYFFRLLEAGGVRTHFIETLNEREMLVKKVQIIPLEVVVRNIAAGSISKRLGLPEGERLPRTGCGVLLQKRRAARSFGQQGSHPGVGHSH